MLSISRPTAGMVPPVRFRAMARSNSRDSPASRLETTSGAFLLVALDAPVLVGLAAAAAGFAGMLGFCAVQERWDGQSAEDAMAIGSSE